MTTSSRAGITRAVVLVLVAGIFSLSQNRWEARRMRQSHKTDASPHSRRCFVVPLAAAAGVLECALLPGRGALVDAPLRSVCQASPCCGKPCRTAPPTRPTPSLRPRSPPSSTPPEVCLEKMEFDIRIRHGPTTTHAPHSLTQGSLGRDEHALPGRAFLAPCAFTSGGSHLVITR